MNGITKSTAACALGIALLGGSVAVATPALAAPSGTSADASATAVQAQAQAQAQALTVTGGLGYTVGIPTTITGTATPSASVRVYGGGVDATVRADAAGVWSAEAASALHGEAQEVRVYSAGQDLLVWAKTGNGDGLAPEYRQIAVTSDLGGFVPGATRTISGVATAHAEVQLYLENPGGRPVPGESGPLTTRADADGNWSFEVAGLFRTKGFVYGNGSGSAVFELTG